MIWLSSMIASLRKTNELYLKNQAFRTTKNPQNCFSIKSFQVLDIYRLQSTALGVKSDRLLL